MNKNKYDAVYITTVELFPFVTLKVKKKILKLKLRLYNVNLKVLHENCSFIILNPTVYYNNCTFDLPNLRSRRHRYTGAP